MPAEIYNRIRPLNSHWDFDKTGLRDSGWELWLGLAVSIRPKDSMCFNAEAMYSGCSPRRNVQPCNSLPAFKMMQPKEVKTICDPHAGLDL